MIVCDIYKYIIQKYVYTRPDELLAPHCPSNDRHEYLLSNTEYRTSDENAERDLKDVVTNFLEVKNNENAQRDDALSMLRKGKEDLLDIKRELSENAK